MSSEFEREIQGRMDDFRMSPNPEVWKQVEAALPEERKRRFALWWWLPIALLLGGAVWYGLQKQHLKNTDTIKNITSQDQSRQTNHPESTITPSAITSTNQREKNILNNDTTISQVDHKKNILVNDNQSPQTETSFSLKETKKIADHKKPFLHSTPSNKIAKNEPAVASQDTTVAKKSTSKKSTQDIALKNRLHTSSAKMDLINDNKRIGSKPNNETTNETSDDAMTNSTLVLESKANIYKNTYTKDSLAKTETSILDSALSMPKQKHAEIQTTNLENPDTAKPVLPIIHKHKTDGWKMYLAAGISNSQSNLVGNRSLAMDAAYNNVGSGVGASQPAPIGSPLRPKGGATFQVGIERSQSINKNWAWYAGAHYSYQSNIQTTAARKDSILLITEAASMSTQKSISVSNYYFPGNAVSHRNNAHNLGLQSGLQYTIMPLSKRPFSILGGFLANWQFASNQLIYNTAKNAYFYAPSQLPNITVGTQVGLDWKLSKRFTWGVYGLYNFTPINNTTFGTAGHWQSITTRISIPLK